MTRVFSLLLLSTTLSMLALSGAHPQMARGTLAGRVTPPSGAVISGAGVLVTNQSTGFSRVLSTMSAGEYSAAALPAGVYTVAISATGFQPGRRDVIVEAGTTTTLNFSMTLPVDVSSVTVSVTTPQIRYESFEVAGV